MAFLRNRQKRRENLRWKRSNKRLDQVRTHITGLLQLDAEIRQEDPNALVRRFYHGTCNKVTSIRYLTSGLSCFVRERMEELSPNTSSLASKGND
jgi:hypothetical protein